MINEEWKPVKGHEGRYEVSNLGRVKSVAGHLGTVILKPQDNGKGYKTVNITTAPKKAKHVYIHRMVADAFIECNAETNLMEVNHKNGDKSDNRVENLEWVTRKKNVDHAVENGLFCTDKRRRVGKQAKAVRCSNGMEYASIYKASKELGIAHSSISRACRGKANQAHGLTFSYVQPN